jgi:hypothetical protein
MWTAEEIEQLRSLLMEEWDPIGVHHFSDDDEDRESYWDEYDSYMPAILSDLDSGGKRSGWRVSRTKADDGYGPRRPTGT